MGMWWLMGGGRGWSYLENFSLGKETPESPQKENKARFWAQTARGNLGHFQEVSGKGIQIHGLAIVRSWWGHKWGLGRKEKKERGNGKSVTQKERKTPPQ